MKDRLRDSARLLLPPLLFFLLVLLAWDRAVAWLDIKPYLVPAPLAVLAAAHEHADRLARATLQTAAGAAAGFAVSLVLGTLVALVFSQSALVRRSVYPYAIFLQTVPIVAIAPIVIHWFGPGFSSVVVVASMISLFPIVTNATTGLLAIGRAERELFEMYNASRAQALFKLRLPSAVPYLVAGAKISAGLSVIGAIVGELFAGFGASTYGLGYLINLTLNQLQTAYSFAALACSTLLGLAIFALANLAGSTILARWHTAGGDEPRIGE